ncbi:MAG: GNAT family N-acetyltransferase [Rhodospirillaceae bacterium]|jgi:GNAT superfamily N-acetyltransferase|nr:GNAT family N-acetyltransferase [Rhodospirillaceae bacterium]
MGEQRKIAILPATPEHADLAAQLIYVTAPPFFDYLYGPDPVFRARLIALQWQAETGFLSHRHTMAAYGSNGGLLGIELGFDGPAGNKAFAEATEIVARHATAEQQRYIAEAMQGLTYVTPHTPGGNYCIHHLAVADNDQARGLGRLLLQGAFDRAAALGYRAVCLDVLENNPAVGFYLHLGMRLACEVRVPGLAREHGFPAVYRMVRDV